VEGSVADPSRPVSAPEVPPPALDRVVGWLRETARRRADRVVDVPGGWGLLHTRYPAAHDHNLLLVWKPVDAGAVLAAADRVLGGAGLTHRRVQVQNLAVADGLDAGLRAAGYARENELLMRYAGDPQITGGVAPVVALTLEERIAAASAAWTADQPGWSPEVCGQLGGRIRTAPEAAEVSFLAVRERERVLARADLFVRDGIAQVEEVGTEPEARNRGLASALVREGVRRAGVDLVFLVADADDWPAALYRRLGFVELGRTVSFSR
jgi:ribosomal protein S18 acetylase RimI-like enzyme